MDLRGKRVLVVGGGRFGERAVRYAREHGARVTLVDRDPACPARALVDAAAFWPRDALAAFDDVLRLGPDWVVPTLPRHLVADWLRVRFGLGPHPQGVDYVSDRLAPALICRAEPAAGMVVASFMADGQCPPTCLPPDGHCRLTGQPRPAPLYRLLEFAVWGGFDLARVLVSQQWVGGLGALRMADVVALVGAVENEKPRTLAVGTACTCHGVLNCLA